MPERIQMSRQRPWRADHPDAVIVARPSKYGNPFRICSFQEGDTAAERRGRIHWWSVMGWRGGHSFIRSRLRAQQIATDEFEAWVTTPTLSPYDWHPDWIRRHTEIRAALASGELRGRDVACWCRLGTACHGDVIIKLANGDPS